MKNKIIQKILTVIFFTGLLVVLKIYFDTPDIAIVFVLVLTVLAGLIRVVVFGYVNPPDWLYRMRFTVLGIGYGILLVYCFSEWKPLKIIHLSFRIC
jgi:uncharacterized membrane protein